MSAELSRLDSDHSDQLGKSPGLVTQVNAPRGTILGILEGAANKKEVAGLETEMYGLGATLDAVEGSGRTIPAQESRLYEDSCKQAERQILKLKVIKVGSR